MPLFFIISGFLHSNKTSNDQLIKYFRTIVVPILFFIVLGGLFRYIYIPTDLYNLFIRTVISIFKGVSIPAHGIIWFLLALLWAKIIMFIFLKTQKSHSLWAKILIPACGLLIIFLCYQFKVYPLFLKSGIMAFPLYFLGFYARHLYNNHPIEKTDYSNNKYFLLLTVFLLFLLSFFLTKINGRISMHDVNFGSASFPANVFLFYFNGIIGSMAIMALSLLFKRGNTFITDLANSLISILGFQDLFIVVYSHEFGQNRSLVFSFVATTLIVLGCFILHKLVMYICPALLGKNNRS